MAAKKPEERNYLYLALGGLFLVALAIIALYAIAAPLEGCVGVVEIKGPIIAEDIPPSMFSDEYSGSETIAQQILDANGNTEVKALLLYIDSPGGSSVATRQIYEAVEEFNKSKVAYFHEMAASGGYYVAAGADYIIANPDTLTGSIGARMTLSEMSGLFSKLGINQTTVKSGEMKDIGSPSRPITGEELAVLESIVNESFSDFRRVVEEGRRGKLDAEGFAAALDARVLSGRQAKKIGLVDELGDRRDAVKKAAELGGIKSEKPRTCSLSEKKSRGIFSQLASEALQSIATSAGIPRLSFQ